MSKPDLVFLKLGGSLLGDKTKSRSFRAAVVRRVGREIAAALKAKKDLRLLIGHGGGGAAHCPAKRYRTREGLPGGGGWRGFAATREGVLTLNRRVLKALGEADLHPILLSPVAGVVARKGRIVQWVTTLIEAALVAGQIPLIHGDAVLDRALGFTICSTEELFAFLAPRLRPRRIVLASDVAGVYVDSSDAVPGAEIIAHGRGRRLVRTVNRRSIGALRKHLRDQASGRGRPPVWDVTGGMPAKVEQLYAMARRDSALVGSIVSGLEPGVIEAALLGEAVGTTLTAR